jgi:hypothetical protein
MTVDTDRVKTGRQKKIPKILALYVSAEAGLRGFGSNLKDDLSNCRQSTAKPSLVIFWGKQEMIH